MMRVMRVMRGTEGDQAKEEGAGSATRTRMRTEGDERDDDALGPHPGPNAIPLVLMGDCIRLR